MIHEYVVQRGYGYEDEVIIENLDDCVGAPVPIVASRSQEAQVLLLQPREYAWAGTDEHLHATRRHGEADDLLREARDAFPE